MIFVTILRVTEILYTFKLVPVKKTGKEIPESTRLEFLDKFSATILPYQMQNINTLGQCIEEVSRFVFFENSISNSPNSRDTGFWEVIHSFVLLTYASLAASRTLLQQPLACMNFDLEFVQIKKVNSMNYGSSKSS